MNRSAGGMRREKRSRFGEGGEGTRASRYLAEFAVDGVDGRVVGALDEGADLVGDGGIEGDHHADGEGQVSLSGLGLPLRARARGCESRGEGEGGGERCSVELWWGKKGREIRNANDGLRSQPGQVASYVHEL